MKKQTIPSSSGDPDERCTLTAGSSRRTDFVAFHWALIVFLSQELAEFHLSQDYQESQPEILHHLGNLHHYHWSEGESGGYYLVSEEPSYLEGALMGGWEDDRDWGWSEDWTGRFQSDKAEKKPKIIMFKLRLSGDCLHLQPPVMQGWHRANLTGNCVGPIRSPLRFSFCSHS